MIVHLQTHLDLWMDLYATGTIKHTKFYPFSLYNVSVAFHCARTPINMAWWALIELERSSCSGMTFDFYKCSSHGRDGLIQLYNTEIGLSKVVQSIQAGGMSYTQCRGVHCGMLLFFYSIHSWAFSVHSHHRRLSYEWKCTHHLLFYKMTRSPVGISEPLPPCRWILWCTFKKKEWFFPLNFFPFLMVFLLLSLSYKQDYLLSVSDAGNLIVHDCRKPSDYLCSHHVQDTSCISPLLFLLSSNCLWLRSCHQQRTLWWRLLSTDTLLHSMVHCILSSEHSHPPSPPSTSPPPSSYLPKASLLSVFVPTTRLLLAEDGTPSTFLLLSPALESDSINGKTWSLSPSWTITTIRWPVWISTDTTIWSPVLKIQKCICGTSTSDSFVLFPTQQERQQKKA